MSEKANVGVVPFALPISFAEVGTSDTGLKIGDLVAGNGALIASHIFSEEAEPIVRAVNCHADLLSALEALLTNEITLNDAGDGWTEITADTKDVEHARLALAKAKAAK